MSSAYRAITPDRSRSGSAGRSRDAYFSSGSSVTSAPRSEPRRGSFGRAASTGRTSTGTGVRRLDILAREGIVPQRTSGAANNAANTVASAQKKRGTSSFTGSSNSSGTQAVTPGNRSRSTNRTLFPAAPNSPHTVVTHSTQSTKSSSVAASHPPQPTSPSSSHIPFNFTRSLGSSWFQISHKNSGNVSLRGGNHSGNGHLTLSANSSSHFLLTHYNIHVLNTQLKAYDLVCQAQWAPRTNLLHLVLCYRSKEDFCVMSIDLIHGETQLRHCSIPSDEEMPGGEEGRDIVPSESSSIDASAGDFLASSSVITSCSFPPFDPPLQPASSMPPYMTVTLRLTPKSVICHVRSSANGGTNNGNVNTTADSLCVFQWTAPLDSEIALDLSEGCVAGILCAAGQRLLVKDWTARPMRQQVTPTIVPQTINGNNGSGFHQHSSSPPNHGSQRSKSLRNHLQQQQSIGRPHLQHNLHHHQQHSQQQTTNGLSSSLLPADTLQQLASLPFEKEIVQAIVSDLLVPPSSSTSAAGASSGSFQRVSFDDIAALEGPKRILTEAVLLPLLLPQFFTGTNDSFLTHCGYYFFFHTRSYYYVLTSCVPYFEMILTLVVFLLVVSRKSQRALAWRAPVWTSRHW